MRDGSHFILVILRDDDPVLAFMVTEDGDHE